MPAFTVIEHDELAAPAATWTSGTFATTYDHLYIVMSMRTDTGSTYTDSTTFDERSASQYGNSLLLQTHWVYIYWLSDAAGSVRSG